MPTAFQNAAELILQVHVEPRDGSDGDRGEAEPRGRHAGEPREALGARDSLFSYIFFKFLYVFMTKKEQSIEHVLPQSWGEGNYWDELIEKFDEAGKPFMRERFTFEEKTKLVHNLGNLCLTQDNSYYSNHDYPRKRNGVDDEDQRCYKRATTHQEKKIAARYEDWNPECILQREKDLIDFAMSRWKFDGED